MMSVESFDLIARQDIHRFIEEEEFPLLICHEVLT
jgi:hypothetical protein